MFKKKPHIKTLAPLRSSDKRKITDEIISHFRLKVPEQEEPPATAGGPQSAATGIGALRASLLPDGSLSGKFTTTAGSDLKTVTGTVYVGTHPGDELRILWLGLEEGIVPTVYTLWRHPQLLPLLHTPEPVLRRMQGGADLMTPGLQRGPPFPPAAKKGSIVAIASLENPSVPMVVGTCEIDVCALSDVRGSKGHAVRGLHWDGDEIWSWSQGGKSGGVAPDRIEGWDPQEGAVTGRELGNMSSEDFDSSHPKSDDVFESEPLGNLEDVDGDGKIYEEVEVTSKPMSTQEIDDTFRNAFLFAMQTARETNKDDPNHGISFPIQQSQLISLIIQPYLPIFHPDDATNMQVKRTSWKNVKKFIKALEKQGLLKAKDRNGGETVVQEVDFENSAISSLVPYKLPKKGISAVNSAIDPSAGGLSSVDSSLGQQLKILTLLKPKDKIAPIFSSSKADLRSLYLPAQLKPIIATYFESENLISSSNRRLITLNPVLANALFDPNRPLDREVLAKGSVPREVLIDRIIESCAQHWAILRDGESREEAKPKSGHPPTIKIILETRSGNKTVTKVSGVEVFFIHPQSLADELQKACASSTSVGQLIGSSPKHPVMEILVQGPQKDIVSKSLEKRGVQKSWIEVLDKTKGKKR